MTTTRQNKVARLVQKEIGNIFIHFTKSVYKNVIISANVVRVSPDLGLAKIYVSVFPNDKMQEILDFINEHKGQIRYELGSKVRHQLRRVPELAFFLDDSFDYMENIDNVLNK
jgi:ribosome-binding factor A